MRLRLRVQLQLLWQRQRLLGCNRCHQRRCGNGIKLGHRGLCRRARQRRRNRSRSRPDALQHAALASGHQRLRRLFLHQPSLHEFSRRPTRDRDAAVHCTPLHRRRRIQKVGVEHEGLDIRGLEGVALTAGPLRVRQCHPCPRRRPPHRPACSRSRSRRRRRRGRPCPRVFGALPEDRQRVHSPLLHHRLISERHPRSLPVRVGVLAQKLDGHRIDAVDQLDVAVALNWVL